MSPVKGAVVVWSGTLLWVDNQSWGDPCSEHSGRELKEALLFGPLEAFGGFGGRKPLECNVFVVEGWICRKGGCKGRNEIDAVLLPLVEGVERGKRPEAGRCETGFFLHFTKGCFPGSFSGFDLAANHAPLSGIWDAGGTPEEQKFKVVSVQLIGIDVHDANGGLGHAPVLFLRELIGIPT